MICAGEHALGEVPADRWLSAGHVDADRRAPGKTVSARGGFLERVDGFDAEFFGVSAREATQTDPQQRLALELAWEALEHAGIDADELRETDASVFMGVMWSDYEKLHGLADIEQHSSTGWQLGVVPGRISHVLGLRGPSVAVNTACSSSLVAIHLACQALRAGESSLALAGGVNLMLAPHSSVMMSKFGGTSASGRCYPWDARAEGYVRGEGGGVVVLRRLDDALAAGDRVLALIRGSAINNDGGGEGLAVPSEAAQRSLLLTALARAGVEPTALHFIEGHGTGTAVGDPIEARVIGQVLGPGRRAPLWLGSLKPNIGHAEAAAGVASLIKVALALDAGVVPPNREFERPNPAIDFEGLGMRVPTQAQPWRGPRLAGVSSFGFGGTNCHVVLEGAPARADAPAPSAAREHRGQPRIVAVSARSEGALEARIEQLRELARTQDLALEGLAHTLWHRRAQLEQRVAIVASTPAQLLAELERVSRSGRRVARERARIAFVFSGQGSQWSAMGRELLVDDPAFAEALARSSVALERWTGWSVLAAIERGQLGARLERIDGIQPALFAMQVALAASWRALGVVPDVVVGHSLGELAAAVVAGALSVEDGARIVAARASLLQRLSGRGGMLSLALDVAAVEHSLAASPQRCAGVSVAVEAGPGATVVSGELAALARLRSDLEARGVECREVAVDVAAHSVQVDPLLDELRGQLAELRPVDARARFVSSVSGAALDGRELGPDYWARNLRERVRFAAAAEHLFAEPGELALIEIAPHPLVLGSLQQLARDRGVEASTTIVPSSLRDRPERESLLRAAAALHCRGLPIALSQPGVLVDLPGYPWQRRRFWPSRRVARERGSSPGANVDLSVRFDPERLGVLAAHAQAGRACVSAGVALELIVRARALFEAELAPLCVEALEFEAAILGDRRVHLSLEGTAISLAHEGADEGARARLSEAPGVRWPERPERLRGVTTSRHDAEQHYRTLAERGHDYEPSLRAIESVVVGEGFARARVRPGQARVALLDALFQVALVAAEAGDEGHVCAGVGSIWLDPTQIEAAAELEVQFVDPLEADARMLDDAGRELAVLRGVRLTTTAREISVLRRRRWRVVGGGSGLVKSVVDDEQIAAPAWLLLGPDDRAARALSAAFDVLGRSLHRAPSVELRPELEGILVAFAEPSDPAELAAPHETIVDACARLLEAVRACVEAREQRGASLRLVVITERAQVIASGERAVVGPSALPSLARVALSEIPDLQLRVIDVGDLDDPRQRRALVGELDVADSHSWLALRPGIHGCDRLVPSLESEPVPGEGWEPRAGTVIVSGGLGGVGRAVVTWLVERGAERVVILGRSELDADGAAFIEGLAARSRAQLRYVSVDVAELDELREALVDELPRTIGVIHSAARLADGTVVEHGRAQLERTMRPKLLGAWNLHLLTRDCVGDRRLDFFVLFGSIGGWIGLPGQASYAAANAALEGLVEHRRGLGLPAVCIGWCGWQGLGFARSAGGAASLERLAREGIGSMASGDALELLDRVISGAAGPAVAVMPPVVASSSERLARAERVAELRALAPVRRRIVIADCVLAEVATVLRDTPTRVDPGRPLRDLGLDSLMSVELGERLARALGLETSPTLIWRHPTVDALVEHFLAQLESSPGVTPLERPGQASVDELDDEELAALLDALSDEEAAALGGSF